MTAPTNTSVVLRRRPTGVPAPGDFDIRVTPVRDPEDGEILTENLYLSIDAAIRGFLDDRPSYLPPVALGETVRGMVLGRVARSRRPDLPEGAIVTMLAGWERYSTVGDAIGLERLDVDPALPLSRYLGVLGPSGLTAYVGLHEIGQLARGQTVLVNAAVGSIGCVVTQIARLEGARVVALVGSPEKARTAERLGAHVAIDYRDADLDAALRRAAPGGIDLYFDNVGGGLLDAGLPCMREHGRVVCCGMIADYNHADTPHGVRNLWQLVARRLTLRGFLTYEHAARLPEARRRLTAWLASGSIVALENVSDGLETAPAALGRLMRGETIGKTLVRL